MSGKATEITVGAYLFRRLHEFGVRGVHGVPGDFNLVLLDLLVENGLYWVGNCNELNAGSSTCLWAISKRFTDPSSEP